MFIRVSTALSALVVVVTAWHHANETCRYIPGDSGWPTWREWQSLNATVAGRLIATVPIAHICHDNGLYAAYNQNACSDLEKAFIDLGAQTLEPQPGEILNPYFQNLSCSPFTPKSTPCELGDRAAYSINVSGPADVQAGFRFAHKNNVRLVIKSTGLDYMGKSTGQGSLELWTYNLKTIEIQSDYQSPVYSGPAVKLGPGVIAGAAYEAVSASGYRIVAPECGLTGIAGGYVQGGGHSQLATAYGMAADQVLEWELVTAEGNHVVATPEQNTDLYWALAGGGGGTYGVVLSMTVKAYKDGPVAGGSLVFSTPDQDKLWEAISIWFSKTPSFVANTSNNVQFLITNDTLNVFTFVLPDQTNASHAVNTLLNPSFLPELDRLGIRYNLSTHDSASYVENLVQSYGSLPYGSLCPTYPIISSRIIPKATVLDPSANAKLMSAFRSIVADGTWFVGCSVINVADTPSHIRPPHFPNAVHPSWRDAIAYCNPNHPWDFTSPSSPSSLSASIPAENIAAKEKLVDTYFPAIEAATPGSGVYLNEMDPLYRGDWKETMYSSANYARLLRIKHRYDPGRLMYARFAVGSDEFRFDEDGRLCYA